MFGYSDLYIEQRRKDWIEVAERERLAREAMQANQGAIPVHYEALAKLGHSMTVLGTQLERRYGKLHVDSPKVAFE